jgi:hypothetical protein
VVIRLKGEEGGRGNRAVVFTLRPLEKGFLRSSSTYLLDLLGQDEVVEEGGLKIA